MQGKIRPYSHSIAIIFAVLLAFAQPLAAQDSAVLTIGTTETVTALDPADANDFFTWELLTHLHTGLTRQKPGTFDYELALAESHSVSTDGLTHAFVIRADAAFSNGKPITAQTFAGSINRVLRLNGRGAEIVRPYVRTVAADDRTLTLTLTEPLPYLLQLVALPPFFPVDPEFFPPDKLIKFPGSASNSNGIYRVSAVEPGLLTLTVDPAWRGTLPAVKTLRFRQYTLPADLREAIRARQVDIAWRGLPPDDIAIALKAQGIKQINAPGLQVFYLLFNHKNLPYSDIIARRGLAHLIDRERAVQIGLQGAGTPLYTLLPSQLAGATAPKFPALDVAAAVKVLGEGGYSNFKRIESDMQVSRRLFGDQYFNATDYLMSALALQDVYQITRFDAEPKTFLDQIERNAFRLTVVGWTPLVPHPDAYLRPLLTGQLAIAGQYVNPNAAELLRRAAQAQPEETASLYAELEALATTEAVALPLWQSQQNLLMLDTVDPDSIQIEPNFLLRYDRLKPRS